VSTLEYVLIVVDASTAEQLDAGLAKVAVESQPAAEVHGLGGGVAEWVMAGSISIHAVATFLRALLPFVEIRQVRSLKIGDVEIIRPRPEDVTRLIDLQVARENTKKDRNR